MYNTIVKLLYINMYRHGAKYIYKDLVQYKYFWKMLSTRSNNEDVLKYKYFESI